jgi:putative ABC transport system permease protein
MFKLARRLSLWLARDRALADLAEEIEAHRAMKQEQFERAGMTPSEARTASRRALGNVTLAKEHARAVWVWAWLDHLRQDSSYALRSVKRSPGFAAALILVTALGIGATTSVFGLVNALILEPLPVRAPERLAWIGAPAFSYPIYQAVRDRSSAIFSGLFAWNLESANVKWTGDVEPGEILTATGDFYATLGLRPALGRFFGPDDDRLNGGTDGLVAVISHACWTRRFGSRPDVIGSSIRIQGKPFTIVGVAPRGFFGVAAGLAPEITVPLLALSDPSGIESRTSAWLHIMGRVRDGLTLEQGNAALQAIRPAVLEITTNPGMPTDRRAKYLSREMTLESGRTGFSRVRRQFEEPLWMLLALVGLLFSVACASAANLLFARGITRQRELAIRLAIGAGRLRLVRQLITESLVWASLGAAVATLFGSWVGSLLIAMMATREEPIVLDVGPSWRVGLLTFGLTLITVIVCSLIPALRSTQLVPASTLKEAGSNVAGATRRWSAGTLLVTLQVALTMVLLVGAALFVRSLLSALSQNAGFDRDNVLVVATDPSAAGREGERVDTYYAALRERLAAIPGVASTSLSVMPPISYDNGNWTQSIGVDGAPVNPNNARFVYFNSVSPGYFATVGMRLQQGRDFSNADTATSVKVAIVNEALARAYFGDANPIGRLVSIGRDKRRQDMSIVGVVANAKYQTLQEAERAIAYLPIVQHSEGVTKFAEVRAHADMSALLQTVRRETRAVDAGVPVRVETVTQRIRESLVTERVLATLASAVGITALVLACAGLYGLLAYAVSRRRYEMGLRLALGATRNGILWMIVRDCLAIASVGMIAGIAGSLALGGYTRTFLYQVQATDALSIVVASVVMFAVAVCAGLLPARAAARVDPALALRGE